MPQGDYMEKIKTTFKENSKEWLITNIYMQCPCRDNLHLIIVPTVEEANKDKDKNYIVVPRLARGKTVLCKIILNQYKTSNKYGMLTYDLDQPVSSLVRKWIENNKLVMGSPLFTQKKLSEFVSKMNKKIGVEGSINYLRHMIISNQKVDDLPVEELVAKARNAAHSVAAHRNYCRLVVAKVSK